MAAVRRDSRYTTYLGHGGTRATKRGRGGERRSRGTKGANERRRILDCIDQCNSGLSISRGTILPLLDISFGWIRFDIDPARYLSLGLSIDLLQAGNYNYMLSKAKERTGKRALYEPGGFGIGPSSSIRNERMSSGPSSTSRRESPESLSDSRATILPNSGSCAGSLSGCQ